MSERVLFTIRDAAGVVVRTGMCGRDDLALQAREGETVEEGHAEQIEVPEVLPLDRVKARAVARVNEIAATIRGQYITVIPGQEMIYLAKEAEAVRYLAETPEPTTLDGYPMLAAEVGITAPTAYELAQLWANMSALWRGIAAQIETARLGAIYQIETAPDAAAVDAIVAAAVAALVAN
jgi:hypothetical protein